MLKNSLFIVFFLLSCASQTKQYSVDDLIGKSDMKFYGTDYKLQKEVNDAFQLMKTSAQKNGIDIKIVSSYRSFEHQKKIWTRKYKKYISQGLSPRKAIDKIIEYSTIPGTSRHHWGTDIDIIDGSKKTPKSVLNAANFKENAVYYDLKKWMNKNANKFGFFLVYTDNNERKGFKYEPWHYSYKPISKPMLEQYLKIDIQKLLKSEKLLGSEYFTEDFINKYIQENIYGINSELK